MSASDPATSATQRIRFDDVVIDFAGCRVLRGGVEQPLEPKAFAVLALLASTPGTVRSRDAILDAAREYEAMAAAISQRH